MKNYLKTFLNMQDEEFLKKHIQELLKRELPQTYEANHSAMDYAEELLNSLGFETERPHIAFDGKTVYQDKVMPLCWSVSNATLTVLSDWEGERVICDYQKEPFSVIRCSTSTPKEGITTRLIPWDRMLAGEDCNGALILLPQNILPTERALPPVLNSGAIGLVSGGTIDSGTRPDDILWANDCSETNCWHCIEGDRDFIGYSVSPNMQRKLEKACSEGEVILKAECDGKRFVGEMPVVTAFLKGESEKEFWILAHNGEPMEDDNNQGVMISIYTLMVIKKAIEDGKIPPLKYSIRLIIAPELYGFAAAANYYGENSILKERCIGAISNDGMPSRHYHINLGFAPTCMPFYSNVLLEGMWREYQALVDLPPYIAGSHYCWSGDSFLSDSDIGLPTIMPLQTRCATHCWHNSYQRFGYINYPMCARMAAVYAAHTAATVCPEPEAFAEFLPTATKFSIKRLMDLAEHQPLRPATDAKARLRHAADIEIANIRDFKRVDVDEAVIEMAVQKINDYVNSVEPVPAAPNPATLILEKYKDIYPKRLTIGIPHDFAAIPFNRRLRPYIVALLSFVFTGMDGKKSLKDLLIEAEWDLNCRYSDEEIEDFVETLRLLAEFEYIKM
ncbi:MAG: hypothetical protein E7551_01655 [Ruminococcaceae bacterium]|nr:hypothetical protein [Oscillospiraceae bacterium]